MQEHCVIESKPDNVLADLRLHKPWGELQRYIFHALIDLRVTLNALGCYYLWMGIGNLNFLVWSEWLLVLYGLNGLILWVLLPLHHWHGGTRFGYPHLCCIMLSLNSKFIFMPSLFNLWVHVYFIWTHECACALSIYYYMLVCPWSINNYIILNIYTATLQNFFHVC